MLHLVYVLLSAFSWFVICGIGWTWILGHDVSMWKMFALAMFSGFFNLSNLLMMRALSSAMAEEARTDKGETK